MQRGRSARGAGVVRRPAGTSTDGTSSGCSRSPAATWRWTSPGSPSSRATSRSSAPSTTAGRASARGRTPARRCGTPTACGSSTAACRPRSRTPGGIPVTRELPGTAAANIGSYVGMPIRHERRQFVGMLCCADPPAAGRPRAATRCRRWACSPPCSATCWPAPAAVAPARRDAPADLRARSPARGSASRCSRSSRRPAAAARGAEALARFDDRADRRRAGRTSGSPTRSRSASAPQLETTAATLALARLGELADDARLTINLSPDLVIDGALDRAAARPDLSRLVVEITEHAPIPDYGAAAPAPSTRTARHGLQLAVDDAGAGYASFRHILNLRPDLIKVDISLVRDIDLDPAQQALVDSLLIVLRPQRRRPARRRRRAAGRARRAGPARRAARAGLPARPADLTELPSSYVRASVMPGRPPAAAG